MKDKVRPLPISLGVLIFLAVLLGGSAGHAPMFTLIVQLVAIPILLMGLARPGVLMADRPTMLASLIILWALVVGLLQLAPLPPQLWRSLPGRGLLEEASLLIGTAGAWHPISLYPAATRAALEYLIPPIAIFVGVRGLKCRAFKPLFILLIAVSLVHALLGTLQTFLPESSPVYLYRFPPLGLAQGAFANRNHAADMYLIGMIAMLAVFGASERRSPVAIWLTSGLLLLFVVLTVRTLSRSGVAMLVIVLLFAWSVFEPRVLKFKRGGDRSGGTLATFALLPVAVAAIFIAAPNLIESLAGRLDATKDLRFVFWPDVWRALIDHLPIGSGLGTFDPVFRSVERLETMSQLYINEAHNDYLQLLLEAGIFGLVGMMAFLLWFGWRAFHIFRLDSPDAIFARAAVVIIGVLLLHSFVDYPLRTLALSSIFAMSCGIISRPFEPRLKRARVVQ